MIPKIIHFCWFGGKEKTELANKCIASWRKHCPDYKFIEWNEKNFDIDSFDYVSEAYQKKKWAFIADYVRLYALYNEGGIYMDTDVEVVKSLDDYLNNKAFSGFEDREHISTGIMACEKGFPLFKIFLDYYNGRHFILSDGGIDVTTNAVTITKICKERGFVPNNEEQVFEGFKIYPKDFFSPKDYKTGCIELTDRTVTIHHFSESWRLSEEIISSKIKKKTENKGKVISVIGKLIAFPFSFVYRVRTNGLKKALLYYKNKIRKSKTQ